MNVPLINYHVVLSPPKELSQLNEVFDKIMLSEGSGCVALVKEYGQKQSREHRHAVISTTRRSDSVRRSIYTKLNKSLTSVKLQKEYPNLLRLDTCYCLTSLYRDYLSKEITATNKPLLDNPTFLRLRTGKGSRRLHAYKKVDRLDLLDLIMDEVKTRERVISRRDFNRIIHTLAGVYYLVPHFKSLEAMYKQVVSLQQRFIETVDIPEYIPND